MLVGWVDPEVRRACSVTDVGQAVWGALGREMVAQSLALITLTATLGLLAERDLFRVIRATAVPLVAVRYRDVEILADPHSEAGPVELRDDGGDALGVDEVDRLLIHDVRCGGRGAHFGLAA